MAFSYLHFTLEPLRAAGLGIVVIWMAVGWPRLLDAAYFGDLSYGLYLLHFPIIQTVVMLGVFAVSPWRGMAIALAATTGSALAMWWVVERPALRRDSAYRQRRNRESV